MEIKYHKSDDGKVVDGKTVVFLPVPRADDGWVDDLEAHHAVGEAAAADALSAAPASPDDQAEAQAAALTQASESGAPFCEVC